MTTAPERMQAVQTFRVLLVPFTLALTFFRLGSQRRFVRLWAWLTLLPTMGPLPQISHFRDMIDLIYIKTHSFYFEPVNIRNPAHKIKTFFRTIIHRPV